MGKPAENVRRAIGAFYQLSEIIKVLAGQRSPTPDEQKLLNDYSRISTVLAQGATQKLPVSISIGRESVSLQPFRSEVSIRRHSRLDDFPFAQRASAVCSGSRRQQSTVPGSHTAGEAEGLTAGSS